jgi:hypothetical protein
MLIIFKSSSCVYTGIYTTIGVNMRINSFIIIIISICFINRNFLLNMIMMVMIMIMRRCMQMISSFFSGFFYFIILYCGRCNCLSLISSFFTLFFSFQFWFLNTIVLYRFYFTCLLNCFWIVTTRTFIFKILR